MCKEIEYDYMNERLVFDIPAVRSKVLDLGSSLSGGLGSNPTAAIILKLH